jgi:NADH:ubiquinone oxidoreductase subunit 6 (subunit J)
VTLEAGAFWTLATVLLASSAAVVLTRNLFHAVLYLAVVLVATAGVFLLLDAAFLFGVQLLLYAGGVVTIVVFAIMLTERLVGARIEQTSRHVLNGALVGAALFTGILLFVNRAPRAPAPAPVPGDTTRDIGVALLTRYQVPLELLAILFVVTLVGALYLARPDD